LDEKKAERGDDGGRMATPSRYVPALRFRSLTRFYDLVAHALLREDLFKSQLVKQAGLQPGHRVLDLGCGTGTLAIMLKRACPAAAVVGLDGDPEILAIARRKIQAEKLQIELVEGLATQPNLPSASFDRVVTSLVFHHLGTEDKKRALAKAHELLVSGGELHVADWGKPQNIVMRLAFLTIQMLDGFETTADNVKGELVGFIRDAGFAAAAETERITTLLGTLSLYRAMA
jgi:ubiquinone/menaquinone biosynthesis C-methylase UbiE